MQFCSIDRFRPSRLCCTLGPEPCVTGAGAGGGTQPGSHDLLVVGPGVLGSLAGKLWLDSFPDATVIGQTNTPATHERCGRGSCA